MKKLRLSKGLITWRTSARAEINKFTTHVQAHYSARAEITFRLHERFSDFLTRLPGLKILARLKRLGFSARAELRPGLNPSSCNRQFDFKRICLRSRAEVSARLTRAEISARAEIRHVNRALKKTNKQTSKKKKRKPASKLGDKGQDPTDPTNHWIRHFDPVARYFHAITLALLCYAMYVFLVKKRQNDIVTIFPFSFLIRIP